MRNGGKSGRNLLCGHVVIVGARPANFGGVSVFQSIILAILVASRPRGWVQKTAGAQGFPTVPRHPGGACISLNNSISIGSTNSSTPGLACETLTFRWSACQHVSIFGEKFDD